MKIHDPARVDPGSAQSAARAGAALTEPSHWYALWTRHQSEQLVCDQLQEKGFRAFLPTLDVWMRRNGTRHRTTVPMFPGYLFLQHAMDKDSYIAIANTRGLIKILGDRWDRLASVPDQEMTSVQRLHAVKANPAPYPYERLQVGQRVRIVEGPLAGIEGLLVRTRPDRGLLVVSIHLLQQSVAVELDYTRVSPL
jgi:transcription termination/antitermination protein NusG